MSEELQRISRLEGEYKSDVAHFRESLCRIEESIREVVKDRAEKREDCNEHQKKTVTNELRIGTLEGKINGLSAWVGGIIGALILMVVKHFAKM